MTPARVRLVFFTAAASLLLICCLQPCFAQDDHYWDWGVGCYYGGLGDREEIDIAMYDWLYLCFGNIGAKTETVEQINRYLQMNPDLKIVIRVWPIPSVIESPSPRSSPLV